MKFTFIRTAVLTVSLVPFVAVPRPCAAQDANRDTVMSPTGVGTVVDRVEKQSRAFRDEFDRAVSHSMIDGTRIEENAKRRPTICTIHRLNWATFSTIRKTKTTRPCANR
jgi:hypothetical protein